LKEKTELIFGYGSLMSFRGLFSERSKKIKILDAFRVQIKGQRGFAKPSSKNNICMDIDNFELKGSVIKNDPEQGYIEGLLVRINQWDLPKVCKREGYDKGKKLICYSLGKNVGETLWNLYLKCKQADFIESIKKYREKLAREIGYTSRDYIPHPIALNSLEYALTFVAPGKYGTGKVNQPSRKEQEYISDLMNAIEVLKRNDVNKKEFLKYFLKCIYGGVHGINVRDIIDSISEDYEFLNNLRKNLTRELIIKEKKLFATTIFDNIERYEQKFGNLDQNLRRSGLKLILDFGN